MLVAYRKGSKIILAGSPEKDERLICSQAGFGGELLTVHVEAGKAILYFILCAPPHWDVLTARLDSFLARQAGDIFERL